MLEEQTNCFQFVNVLAAVQRNLAYTHAFSHKKCPRATQVVFSPYTVFVAHPAILSGWGEWVRGDLGDQEVNGCLLLVMVCMVDLL